MFKRMFVMLLLCALVLGAVFGYKMFGKIMMGKAMAGMANPPQTVSTMKAAFDEWQNEIRAVGTLRAVKGADLSSEVVGTVENIFFESGQDVTEGTLLVQLRSADDRAKLDALEASLRNAELTFARDEKQIKDKAVSQATYDADKANLENLKAQTAAQRATLEKKTIAAPFEGRLGLRQVDIGQYLNAGTAIVTLQQLDPIYVDFSIPQQELTKLNVGQKIAAKTDAFPGQTFEGEISAINPKIDESTRNVDVRATIHNPEKTLRPGMFATVSLKVGEPQKFLTLPQTAITYNPYGNTVFIVQDKGVDDKGQPKLEASSSFVQTGLTRGDQVAVLSGIKEGDEIVTAGQLKLHNGSPVIVNNAIQPANDPNPKPEEK